MRAWIPTLSLFFVSWFLLTGLYTCRAEPSDWQRVASPSDESVLSLVNPFIGTDGLYWARGHTSPAATAPFGMIKLGPDTTVLGRRFSHSGYAYNDPEVRGFSHTRYSGTGVAEGGILQVVPSGVRRNFSELKQRSFVISKNSERASPGYYSVYLPDVDSTIGVRSGVGVELAARKRGAVHRYRFERANPVLYLQLNSAHRGDVDDLSISIASNGVSGSGRLRGGFSGRYDGLPFFFSCQSSLAFEARVLTAESEQSEITSWTQSEKEEAYLEMQFTAGAAETVEFRCGLSYVQLSGAQQALSTVTGSSFESVLAQTQSDWEGILGRIGVVSGGSRSDKVTFYSALYRSFLMPTQFGDADGSYLGFDKSTHSAAHPYYSDFSLWDTYRTVHPLYNLIAREEHRDMLRSLILMADQGGSLPRWPSGGGYSNSMLGLPATIALSEAYQKGIDDFDVDRAIEHMKRSATPGAVARGQECLADYVALGFCPEGSREGHVSGTLEFTWADHALALILQKRSDPDWEQYWKRSLNFENHFDARFLGFFPKTRDGQWVPHGPMGPAWDDNSYLKLTRLGHAYVEGGARHWRFYPIYHWERMKELMGDQFVSVLDEFFVNAKAAIGQGFPPYYFWQGNEPSIHNAYWFSLVGDYRKTQEWAQWVMRNKYQPEPMGLDGDDDAGTLSAWYVLSAMGFFPIAGTSTYVLGFPIFDELEVNLGDSKSLTLKRVGAGPWVTQVRMDGETLTQNYFDHDDIADGATIEFVMGE